MKLDLYDHEKYAQKLKDYQLNDIEHTDAPQNIINKAKVDLDRYPIVILNDSDELVGFFCLHLNGGPKGYGFYEPKYALLRGFSIDERYRNQGLASRTFDNIFDFITEKIDKDMTHLILAVNEKNIIAQKAYQNSGFLTIKTGVAGTLGNLLIMEKVNAHV